MAETRETQVLEDVVESTEIENPRTTEEAILAQVVAGDEVTINARTRLQKYLSQLTSGGPSVEVEPLNVTENDVYTAPSGKAYSPVTVDVPNPNSAEIITGTLENPWGDLDVPTLRSKIGNGEASAKLTIGSASAPGATAVDGIVFGSCYFTNATDQSPSLAASVSYFITGSFNYAKMLYAGAYVDMPSTTPCTLTVIYHPLPEDNT